MHTLTAVIIDKPSQSPKVIQDQPMTPTSDLEFNEDIKQSTDNKAFLKTQQQLLSTTKSTFTQNNSFYNPYQSQVNHQNWFYSRIQWVEQPKHDKNGISGLYLFGGMDDQGNVSNDVWHIKPSYSKNLDNLAPGTHEYRENFEKKLFYDISLVKTMGKPPIARYCHQAVCFQSKYLLIHGGRNNKEAYDLTRNVALNDMAMLDLERKTWIIINMQGLFFEQQRDQDINILFVNIWSHSLVNVNDDKIYVIGGQNMLSFCKANIYCFYTDRKKIKKELLKIEVEKEENQVEMKKYKFI